MKRPNESGQIDDPKYCKYHHLVGHPIHDYFIFKDKVMKLVEQGKIVLDEANVTTNVVTTEATKMIGIGTLHESSTINDEDSLTVTFSDEDLQLGENLIIGPCL